MCLVKWWYVCSMWLVSVVLPVAFSCWLPSMSWLLCGDDGSKKTKTTSVISKKSRERIYPHYGFN